MVVPLLDMDEPRLLSGVTPGTAEIRPGFIAFSKETLPSPFHVLEAVVDDITYNKYTRPDIGTDPVDSADPVTVDPGPTRTLAGEMAGLTYESENAVPYFAQVAPFYRISQLIGVHLPDADIFVHLRFRWKYVYPGNAGNGPAAPLTGLWIVRLLNPFAEIGGIKVSNLRFRMSANQVPEFYDVSGSTDFAFWQEAPSTPIDVPDHEYDRGFEKGLLFICWKEVPNPLGLGKGRRPTGFFILRPGKPPTFDRLDGDNILSAQENYQILPDKGQFMLVDARPGALAGIKTINDFTNNFFPYNGSFAPTTDAKCMIVRISYPIRMQQ
jgi:hypothetical protein